MFAAVICYIKTKVKYYVYEGAIASYKYKPLHMVSEYFGDLARSIQWKSESFSY